MIMFCLSIMRCRVTIKRLTLRVCQVTNYHVVEKLATDRSGLQRCKVLFVIVIHLLFHYGFSDQ